MRAKIVACRLCLAAAGHVRAALHGPAVVAARNALAATFAAHVRPALSALGATLAAYIRPALNAVGATVAAYIRPALNAVGATIAAYFQAARRAPVIAAVRDAVGPVLASHLRASLRVPIAVALVVVVGPAVAGYLTTTTILHSRSAAAAPPRLPLPPAKPSWVTDEEVIRQRERGRLLLAISPAELLSLYEHKGSDAVETYRDKWVKIDYPIASISKQTFGKTTYDVVEATAHFQSVFPAQIIAYFSEQKWDGPLSRHLPKDQIVAFCQFKDIDRETVLANLNRLRFYGIGCDLPQRG